MNPILRGVFATDSGMLAIWSKERFHGITDYDSWERELLEDADIIRRIEVGAFVPINIQSDGAFACEVRYGDTNSPAELSEREKKFLVVASDRYLFRSAGESFISGIEHVEREPGSGVGRLCIPAGCYSAIVHIIGWDDEPGAKTADGKPASTALPDFVILLNPIPSEGGDFRKKVDTFEEPA